MYASTREEELAPLGWDAATQDAFLRPQFSLQSRGYRSSHPEASFDLILVDGAPAGRFYVDRSGEAIHVIEIALLPAYRGRGIGTGLLRALLREAVFAGKRVTINALHGGAAIALYQRLGFEIVREGDVYIDLEWAPS